MATAKNTKVQEDTAMATAAITQQDDAVIKIEHHADTPNASGNLSDEDANTDTKLHPPDRDDDERSPTRRPYPIRDARMMTSCPSPSPQNIVTSGLTAANFATPPPPEKRGDNLLLQPPSTTSTELHSGLSMPSLLRFPSQPQPGHDAATMLSLNTPNLVNPNEAEQHMEHIVIPRIRLAMRPSNRNNSPNHQHHDDDDATGGAIDRREMTTTAGFVPIVQVQHDPREGGEEEDDE